MQALEREFDEATASGVLPGVLLAAANIDGSLNYFKSFGKTALENGAAPTSATTTFVLASATKIVTCVAVMQCVERGLVELDVNISRYLPEWKDPMILTVSDEENGGKPILEKAKNPITLRHLLSHTSGITGLENEQIMEYYNAMGNPRGTLIMRYFMSEDPEVKEKALSEVREFMGSLIVEPLIFEPGTKWAYGQGIDWAGQIVERVTNVTLEAYCKEHIFAPLSMTSTSFRLLNHPHIAANLMKMHYRNKDGKVEETTSIYPVDPKVDMGGSNLYTSAPDFLKFLSSLLRNDGKLLKPKTADMMFDYRLPDTEAFEAWKTDAEAIKDRFGDMASEGLRVDHCLAGLVVLSGLKGGRRAGSVNWAGATGTRWWIDRAGGICGFYGSQLMIMGEQQISSGFFRKFERAIYAAYGGEN